MILVNTVLVHCSIGFIGVSSSFVGSCFLVELMLFLIWCMWTLDVSIDGGICLLIRSIVKLVHVAKYPFLVAWMRVCFTGLNSVELYHCAILGFVLSVIKFFAYSRVGVGLGCGVVVSCTFHMPTALFWVPSRINYHFFLYWHVCGSECGCTAIITELPYED